MAIDSFANVAQFTTTRASVSSASVTTTAITTGNGNSFIVVVGCGTGGTHIPSTAVTDSKGNTYTRTLASVAGLNPGVSIFYKQAGVGGASHTFTFTPTSSDFIWICAIEVTGMKASPVSGTNAGAGGTTTHSSGTITSVDTELWVGAGVTNATAELIPTLAVTPWLLVFVGAALTTTEGAIIALRSVASGVTDQFTFGTASSATREAMIAGFKIQLPSAGGGGATSVAYLG